MLDWITTHYAGLTAILLATLRLAESITIIAKAEKAIRFIAVVKEFFRFG